MYKAEAYYNGKMVYTDYYDETVTTEQEAKTHIINALYWNVISCTMASSPKWWEKFDIKVINLDKVTAYQEMRKATGTENKHTIIDLLNKEYPNTNFNDQAL